MWEELLQCMNELRDNCHALIILGQQKKDILTAAQTSELDEITRQEESLVLQMSKMETKRAKLIRDIADIYGKTGKGLTLKDIITLADENTAVKLTIAGADMRRIAEELSEMNKLNMKLVEHGLRFINYSLHTITSVQSAPTYAAKGEMGEPAPSRGLLDTKA